MTEPTNTDPLLGRTIQGRYKLLRAVGKGGMGAVYEAEHTTTQKRVAMKILASHLSKDLKLIARFRREAMAASRLDHDNCVTVYDFGEDVDGTFFIAMEFVDGVGLGTEIRRNGPMDQARVARIGTQLLSALDGAHANGILHRDLKPQNIMLTRRGSTTDLVKVVDFGIAKFISNSEADQAALTVPGTIFGTPEYMSPEQARGEPLDARSDLYSAAVVLWHLLLGRSPFRGKTVRETLVKVFSENPPSPRKERSSAQIDPAFEECLKGALRKDRDARYPDAAAFLLQLRPFLDGTVVDPAPQRAPVPGRLADGTAPETVGDGDDAHLSMRSSTLVGNPPPPSSEATSVQLEAATELALNVPEDEMHNVLSDEETVSTEVSASLADDEHDGDAADAETPAEAPADAPPPDTEQDPITAVHAAGVADTTANAPMYRGGDDFDDASAAPAMTPQPKARVVTALDMEVHNTMSSSRRVARGALSALAGAVIALVVLGVAVGGAAFLYRYANRVPDDELATKGTDAGAAVAASSDGDGGPGDTQLVEDAPDPALADNLVLADVAFDAAHDADPARRTALLKKARDWYKKAVSVAPDHVDANHRLALVHFQLKEYAEAKAQFERLFALKPAFKEQYATTVKLLERLSR